MGKDRIFVSTDKSRAENKGMKRTLRGGCGIMDDIGIDGKAVTLF